MYAFIEFMTALIALCTGLGYGKKIWWGLTVVDFFRLQYAAVAGILLFLGFFYGAPHLILINAVLLAVNMFRIRGFFPQRPVHTPDHPINIISVNAYKDNNSFERLAAYIDNHQPEILLLMETTDEMKLALKEQLSKYPYKMNHYVRDGFEILLLSTHEMKDAHNIDTGDTGTPLLSCKINWKGRDLRLYSAHPPPAINPEYFKRRQKYFRQFSEIIQKEPNPIVALGDFNSVPWEQHFKAFLKRCRIKSTLEGHGYRVTWPRYFPIMGVPMDHILVTDTSQVKLFHVGPDVGSDHFPVGIYLD